MVTQLEELDDLLYRLRHRKKPERLKGLIRLHNWLDGADIITIMVAVEKEMELVAKNIGVDLEAVRAEVEAEEN